MYYLGLLYTFEMIPSKMLFLFWSIFSTPFKNATSYQIPYVRTWSELTLPLGKLCHILLDPSYVSYWPQPLVFRYLQSQEFAWHWELRLQQGYNLMAVFPKTAYAVTRYILLASLHTNCSDYDSVTPSKPWALKPHSPTLVMPSRVKGPDVLPQIPAVMLNPVSPKNHSSKGNLAL
jgi:hypothetical protein